ncbi:hypothetical protein L9H26_19065 [Morganella psychrotolerans]|uniref:Uncharacterized protein n=1 Tax=Morganella psychrotolerans TaxID=368603 RepID=A0A5M9QWT4_9GAMM|nr:hypothetical protein [Morganella psychrotolerans]KAA8713003.1 hypothetical protein F4V73_17965 [Morganella psychrotolerans]OBU01898.1 hypothetical protein AYY16_16945 [Morganella psychrotolerans]
MKIYFLIVCTALLNIFLLCFLTPTLFSAKSDFGVLGALIVVFFIVPVVTIDCFKQIKKWSVR